MEKNVIIPMSTFEKIAKYHPENAKIEILTNLDNKEQQLLKEDGSSTLDPVAKSFAYALNKKQLEISREKVFPPSSKISEKNATDSAINVSGIKSNFEETAPNDHTVDDKNGDNGQNDSDKKDDSGENGDVEKKEEENIEEKNKKEDKNEEEEEEDKFIQRISPNQSAIKEKLMSLDKFEYQKNTKKFKIGKDWHPNLDRVLDYIVQNRATPREQVLRHQEGTTDVLRALSQIPDFDFEKIEFRKEIKQKLRALKQEKIGGCNDLKRNSNILIINKLPYKILKIN